MLSTICVFEKIEFSSANLVALSVRVDSLVNNLMTWSDPGGRSPT